MRVLIVDDDEVSRDMVARLLESHGYETVVAANGREALEILARGDCRLVISDWIMPEVNGLTLCRAIRQGDFGGYIYIILLTVREGEAHMNEALAAGADDFLSKPYDARELRKRVAAGERYLVHEAGQVAAHSQ